MSKVFKKFLNIGTGLSDINAQSFPAIYTPTNYTPNQVTTEGTDKISAHLKGIDNKLSSYVNIDGGTPESVYGGTNPIDGGTP